MTPKAGTLSKCSKCGDAMDLMLAKGTAQWCKKCRAKYQADYKTAKERLTEAQGFARGVEAMRNQIASKFAPFPMAIFGGSEVVRFIGGVAPPPAVVIENDAA